MKHVRSLGWITLALLVACGGSGNGNNLDGSSQDTGMGDGGARDGATGDGTPGDGSRDGSLDGTPGDGSATCGATTCGPGERCDRTGTQPACVPNTCADLHCAAPNVCRPAPTGLGNVCQQVGCTDSIQCMTSEFCNGTVCTTDVCTAGVATCGAGGAVSVCASDGSGATTRFTCGGSAYFTSTCMDGMDGAYCPCEDDWDCPANTACEAGRCEGTGSAPTCRLPPAPFSSVLPSPEPGFPWGGTGIATPQAVNSPFSDSAQVVMTPLVINLDDDTGDGRVNENDYPEILFLTFCNHDISTNGVLRAVHGGGANRGKDAWASCGTTAWHEGDPLTTTCACADADLNSTAGIAAGDLDNDGVPEVVAITETATVRVYSNRGVKLAESTGTVTGANPSPAIANLDNAGLAEIIVGRNVFTLARGATGALTFVDQFTGTLSNGVNGQGPISCMANVAGGPELEIIAGSAAYRLPTPPAGVTRRSDCPVGNTSAFCTGALDIVWDAVAVNSTSTTTIQREGFCAVADVMGAVHTRDPGPANPLDGTPEVITVANGHIQIFDGATGTLERDIVSPAAGKGGAPNVDDFDGDGFPEIGTAFSLSYVVFDLQGPTPSCPAWPTVFVDGTPGLQGNPARTVPTTACNSNADCGASGEFACNTTLHQCVCLHNDWRRTTEDDSSNVTGSTVFDFNGDGAAEIIYNDECYFRIYSGLDGSVLFREASESRTRTENPVVADVDNDGNAEIIFGTSNESGFCSDRTLAPQFNNGIEVWGDQHDLWVSARKVWNEHQYHVTNVLESGGVPAHEPESWRPYGGRQYNTYRSQPRSSGIAPNLVVQQLQMSSPGATCGTLSTQLTITARVANVGDLRVGPDLLVGFYGIWNAPARDEALFADAAMTPLRAPLGTTLEPGQTVLVTVNYDARFNAPGTLPDQVRAQVDDAMAETECIETDNTLTRPVMAGAVAADLTVELGTVGGSCPERTFETTVRNAGGVPANNVLLRYYLGNPAAGGEFLHDEVLPNPVPAGGSVTVTVSIQYPVRDAVVYVVVDPDDTVPECNDANNTANTADRVVCVPG